MGRTAVGHAADDGVLVGLFGQLGQQFADADPAARWSRSGCSADRNNRSRPPVWDRRYPGAHGPPHIQIWITALAFAGPAAGPRRHAAGEHCGRPAARPQLRRTKARRRQQARSGAGTCPGVHDVRHAPVHGLTAFNVVRLDLQIHLESLKLSFVSSMPIQKFRAVDQRPGQIRHALRRLGSLCRSTAECRAATPRPWEIAKEPSGRAYSRFPASSPLRIRPTTAAWRACFDLQPHMAGIQQVQPLRRPWVRLLRSDSKPVSRGGRPNISRNELVMLPSARAIERCSGGMIV